MQKLWTKKKKKKKNDYRNFSPSHPHFTVRDITIKAHALLQHNDGVKRKKNGTNPSLKISRDILAISPKYP